MKPMRMSGREKDSQWVLEIFDKDPFITFSMISLKGIPYVVPLSLLLIKIIIHKMPFSHYSGRGIFANFSIRGQKENKINKRKISKP